jgi:hypothetical protein
MTAGERAVLWICGVAALVALILACVGLALVLRELRHERHRTRSLEERTRELCARKVVTGLKLTSGGRISVQTTHGC